MGILKSAALKKVWQEAEGRMPKVLTAETHGVIDYLHAAVFFGAAAYFWRRDRRAGVASLATAGFLLVEAMLTDYPLGVKPLISFAAHGRLDRGFAAFTATAQKTLELRSNAAARFFQANAFAEGLVLALTDFEHPHARVSDPTSAAA